MTLSICTFAGSMAYAHFQMIIPSDEMVSQTEKREISLDVRFTHPFEGHGMNEVMPAKFGVVIGDKNIDLLNSLKEVKLKDRAGETFTAYKSTYALKQPGDHIFYVEPKPYWEPAEESFIVHYTKVIVNSLGMEEGWDQEVGLKTEIVPLTRPYGLWAGNVFQGIVQVNGKPVPYSEVEVEYYNEDGSVKAPADPMVTQVVKADGNGVFTYAMPRAGWWGFAALNTDENTMVHEGKDYPVEIGAVLWVKTYEMGKKK
ncbi:MAG: DUF4198 domain-containing protein [Nitrospirae bacterium]|nr:DUF4198 domain-containing protein [Nitrospirota bacterium]